MVAPARVALLIKARYVLPIIPAHKLYENCAIAVDDEGKIIALLPSEEADKRYCAEQTLQLNEHLLMPGLINAHGHAAMTLLRGLADDAPLQDWLENTIWPAEQQHVSEDFVRDGALLAIAEMIQTGTTCFADMYFFPKQTAQAAYHAQIRCQVNFPIFEFASAWGTDADDYFAKGLAVYDYYRTNELITVGFGPHAPYTVSNASLAKVSVLAEELQTSIHIHVHETEQEIEDSLQEYNQRPLARLAELGLLSPLTQCVHMTQINDEDIALLQQYGAHVVHCPQSNLKLASGFCPVDKLQKAGINVALGTDGAASNNSLDLFSELKLAALLSKAIAKDATATNAHDSLAMATINGARALGLEEYIGSLEAGKFADMIAINFGDPAVQPLYNPVSQLVYTNSGSRVSHVWVAGKALLLDRQLQTLNERELQAKARWWHQRLAQ